MIDVTYTQHALITGQVKLKAGWNQFAETVPLWNHQAQIIMSGTVHASKVLVVEQLTALVCRGNTELKSSISEHLLTNLLKEKWKQQQSH